MTKSVILALACALLALPGVARADDEGPSFLDNVSFQAHATSYYLLNGHRTPNSADQPGFRAYARNQGFGLTFAGFDVSYTGDHFGATLNIRLGEGADLLIDGSDMGPIGLNKLKQGYVSWMPTDQLTFDVGWFDTIYGAEVADEWDNVNFTRGALYFLMQPFNHTGLRASYQATDTIGFTVLVVNGMFDFNENVDNDETPSVGAQIAVTPNDDFSLYLGWAGDASDGNKDWSHFLDLVATAAIGDLSLVLNADLRFDNRSTDDLVLYYGVSLAGTYAFCESANVGARIEWLGDPDGYAGISRGGFDAEGSSPGR